MLTPSPASQCICTHTSGAALGHHTLTGCLHTPSLLNRCSSMGIHRHILGVPEYIKRPIFYLPSQCPSLYCIYNQDRANYYHFNYLVLTRNQQRQTYYADGAWGPTGGRINHTVLRKNKESNSSKRELLVGRLGHPWQPRHAELKCLGPQESVQYSVSQTELCFRKTVSSIMLNYTVNLDSHDFAVLHFIANWPRLRGVK